MAHRILACMSCIALASACASPPGQRQAYEPRSFLGYACAGDCEGHKAGFAWAERRGIDDLAGCARLERALQEGCRVYAEGVTTPEQAGYQWALENEVVERRSCDGAGRRFRAGCLQQLLRNRPINTY